MVNLSAEIIENILTPSEIIEVVKKGVINCELGHYNIPTRMHLESPTITNLVMPAVGRRYFCTKLVSVVPNNPKRGLPIILGTVVLSKMETGETVALLDAPMITALRTAAVGALGFDLISQSAVRKIGVIGLGVQGIWQTIFACAVRDIQQVYCYSRTETRFESYKKKVLERCPKLEIIWCKSGEEVVQKAQVIYACTTSSKPVFPNDEKLITNKRFVSVGSYKRDMQELPDVVYQHADTLLIDSSAATHEVGDVINAIDKKLIDKEQIFTFGKLYTKDRTIEPSNNIVFKSVGMAAFDLALASAVYEKARIA